MSEKSFSLICSCCGAECGQRDQTQGRCGSCGSFFTGDEQVVEHEALSQADAPLPAGPADRGEEASSPEPATTSEPATAELEAEPADSEELVKPRKLSPQFRRHIQMTWQPAMADGESGAQRTISDKSRQEATKRDSFWESIGTRRVSPSRDSEGGDYKLKGVIGEGSMGRVWSAQQTSLDREVAVKVPLPEVASMGSVGESQFISEVVVTGKLEHPNIVPIYELGRDTKGVPFYSMKHVQGRPWNEIIDDKSEAENIEILMKVCDAIAFAHDRHFLHRDIKPHNVMVGEFGEVSVMDWGIAVSLLDDPARAWIATASGPAGTPAYMAPEMAAYNASELGVVSDVYLLGAVLYEIVTGSPPHPCIGDTNEALLAAAANEIIPTERNGELVDIARRAMATNLDQRYQSVQEFQDALRAYQSHRQSIKLAESADQHLASAIKSGRSDEFARARFAFEESLRLWSANAHAVHGLREATIAHAENALKQEDFELGISILDANNPAHRELLGRLQSRRAKRRRQTTVAKFAAAIAVAAILGVIVVLFQANTAANLAAENEKDLREKATEQARLAEIASGEADREAKAATKARVEADQQRDAAEEQKKLAQQSEYTALVEKKKAVAATYVSEIGIAAASIRRNEFPKAAKTITDLASREESISRLRHIEWGILQHSANPPAVNLLEDEPVTSVAISTDGNVLAAGLEDGRFFIWLRTAGRDDDGKPVRLLVDGQHGKRVNAIALSADGRHIATAGVDQEQGFSIRQWQTSDGRLSEATTLKGHSAEVLSLAFSDDEDARYLVSSGADRMAIKWDRARGTRLATMRDHLATEVWSARFAPHNSNRIVTACDDGRVRVWETKEGGPSKIADFRGHSGPVYAAVFSPDGETVFSGGYGRRLLRWRVEDHKATTENRVEDLLTRSDSERLKVQLVGSEEDQHESSIASLDVVSVGGSEIILSGGNDNTLRVWTRPQEDWELKKTLRGHGRWIRDCAFSDNGQAVVSGAFDGFKIWNWRDYEVPRELFANSEQRIANRTSEIADSAATGLAVSPDGWIATAYQNGTVAVWNLASGDRTTAALLGDGHLFLTATAIPYHGGRQLLTSAADNTTRLWDMDRGTETTVLEGTGWRGAAAIHWREVNQTALVVTGSDDRLVPAWLWQVSDGAIRSKKPLLEEVTRQVLTSAIRPSAGELTTDDLRDLRRLRRRIADVTTVAFSQSGDRFLLGDSQGQCFLFNVDRETATASQIARFAATRGTSVRAAAFVPTGDFVITAGSDGQIFKWDLTGEPRADEFPFNGPVNSLEISSDGAWLLIGYAAVKGQAKPLLAQRLDLSGDATDAKSLRFSGVDFSGAAYDASQSPPAVQSARFGNDDDHVILSLFFPAKATYQLGEWDLNQGDIKWLEATTQSEITAASLLRSEDQERLLVVGGKGARLLAEQMTEDQSDRRRFTQLVASFRAARSVTALGFAYDPQTAATDRLVTGDDEGNIRIWQLNQENGQWSDNVGAGAQLVGQHVEPIVAVGFDPQDKNQLLTADRSGKWIWWTFADDQWSARLPGGPELDGQRLNCVALSPDGSQIFFGTDQQARVYETDAVDLNAVAAWATGSIRTATYSDDGNWIATAEVTDKDEVIRFWSRDGAKLDEVSGNEDAKGLTTIDWSWDRRRLITGNRDGEVIVWDTSKLVDKGDNAGEIKPLLTLEDHQQNEVVAVAVSPNARDLLSADKTGRTILLSGAPVTPIAITQSRTQVSLKVGEPAKPIDPEMILSDPSRLADFSQAEISVTVDPQQDPLPAGRLTNLEPIRASLTAAATAATVETLLRQLQYGIPKTGEATLPGASPGDALVSGEQPTPVTRTLTIEIRGVRYRDSGEDLDLPAEQKPLSVEFKLEIERISDDSAEPSQAHLTSIGG